MGSMTSGSRQTEPQPATRKYQHLSDAELARRPSFMSLPDRVEWGRERRYRQAEAEVGTDAKVAAIEAESAAQIAKQQQGATATLQATINQGTVTTNRNAQPKESAPVPEPNIEGAQQATDPRRKYRGGGEPSATRGGAGIRLT